MHDWIKFLYTLYKHNIGNQLYSNIRSKWNCTERKRKKEGTWKNAAALWPFSIPTTSKAVLISSVQLLSCLRLFATPWTHARLPSPSPTPGACSNSCPSSQWCHPIISSSFTCVSSCPQSFPATRSFLVSRVFESGSQSIGASVSASVPSNEYSGLISFRID